MHAFEYTVKGQQCYNIMPFFKIAGCICMSVNNLCVCVRVYVCVSLHIHKGFLSLSVIYLALYCQEN